MGRQVLRRPRPSVGVAALLAAGLTACSGPSAGAPAPATPTAGSPAAPSTGPPSSPRPSPAPAPRAFDVVVSGDVLVHPGVWQQAAADTAPDGPVQDFRPLLAGLRPVVAAADLAVCHLETPLAPSAAQARGYPSFAAPPELVDGLAWTGYDVCTTASNHTLDAGVDGLVRTLDALAAAGIRATGSSRSAQEDATPLVTDVAGVRVALLSYTYGTNGVPLPRGKPWSVSVLPTTAPAAAAAEVLSDARAARTAGAEVVLVAYHWGQEYVTAPTAAQRDIAERVLADGAVDLLYGHHAHVVQPFDVVAGRWVAYGLGNLVADHATPARGVREGVSARFTFSERPDGTFAVDRAEYVPTYVTDPEVSGELRVLVAGSALADPSTSPVTREAVAAALARVDVDVEGLGAREEDGLVRDAAPAGGSGARQR